MYIEGLSFSPFVFDPTAPSEVVLYSVIPRTDLSFRWSSVSTVVTRVPFTVRVS